MNPDTIIILISGITGAFAGATVTCAFMAVMASRAAQRADKHAWAAANLYYTRKEKES